MPGGGTGSGSPGHAKRRIEPPAVATRRAPLAVSSTDPPPMATTASCPATPSPAASTDAIVGSPAATTCSVGAGGQRLGHGRQPGDGGVDERDRPAGAERLEHRGELGGDAVAEAHAHRKLAGEGRQRIERHGA